MTEQDEAIQGIKQSQESRLSDSVLIVLSRTTHPGNIGAVARAMKNMGLSQLRLVSPSPAVETLSDGTTKTLAPQDANEAVRRASGAHDILEQCQVFDSLSECLSDAQVVVGASARTRKMEWQLIDPRQTAQLVVSHIDLLSAHSGSLKASSAKVALVFGNEASGLSNEELQLCNYHVNIPAVESFASLNLAMAVQLISYELRMALLACNRDLAAGKVDNRSNETDCSDGSGLEKNIDGPTDESVGKNAPNAVLSSDEELGSFKELSSVKEFEGFLQHLEDTLIKLEFLDPANPRQLMPKLRRLYSRTQLEKVEINILRGILTATQKFLK